jgi:predicted transcriptional regulator
MRNTATMSVSLPRKMIDQFERVRQTEQRTRSELVREALRIYFTLGSDVDVTKAELTAIRRGRAEIARGEFVTLKELRHGLGSPRRKSRSKGRRKGSRKRPT